MAPSWRAVAEALAARMEFHTVCGDGHADSEDGCPFCADIAAYRMFKEKHESVFGPPPPRPPSRSVSLAEVSRDS